MSIHAKNVTRSDVTISPQTADNTGPSGTRLNSDGTIPTQNSTPSEVVSEAVKSDLASSAKVRPHLKTLQASSSKPIAQTKGVNVDEELMCQLMTTNTIQYETRLHHIIRGH